MMRVISSPSISTTVPLTLIFCMCGTPRVLRLKLRPPYSTGLGSGKAKSRQTHAY
jgi:hypothetical protein